MTIQIVLKIVAIVCFVLAIFGVPLNAVAMLSIGLATWCGSTLP